MFRRVLALTLAAVMVVIQSPISAFADDCNPTAGDQMYAWVDGQASQISHELARTDYNTRVFNYFLLSYDDVHQRIETISATLNDVERRIKDNEASYQNRDAIEVAISRDADSQALLNDLFAVRGQLDTAETRYSQLVRLPSRTEFELQGLGNVGRVTLLTSFEDLGSKASNSLQSKFNISLSISTDDTGNIRNATMAPSTGPVDAVALAVSSYIPYGYFFFAVFEMVKMVIGQEECDRKVQHQRDRLVAAFRLLPSKLITADEQYGLYASSYQAWLNQFQSHSDNVKQALQLLENQWKNLLAYNVERNKTAQKLLTAEKLKRLGEQYGSDRAVTTIFNNIGASQFAENIADVNAFLARNQKAFLLGCKSPSGLHSGEDYLDSLQYAVAAFRLLQHQSSLTPLSSLLEQSLDEIDVATPEASRLMRSLPACGSSERRVGKDPRLTFRSAKLSPALLQGVKLANRKENLRLRSRFLAPPPDWSFCTLVSPNGQTYDCEGVGGGVGGGYAGNFDASGQDPYATVLLGARDGGYAEDNRQVSMDLQAATANLSKRIADLNTRSAAAKAALPDWMAKNQTAIATAIEASTTEVEEIANQRTSFASQNADALAGADAVIEVFIQSPYDRGQAVNLLSNMSGSDLSLPNLPADAVLPNMPPIAGVSAAERVYGNAAGFERDILRETLKVNEQLTSTSTWRGLALEDIEDARRFAATKTNGGSKIAAALIDDSAALRYLQTGLLTKLSYTTVASDGTLGRSEIDSTQVLPDNSLIRTIERFDGGATIYTMKLAAAKTLLQPGLPGMERRQDVLQVSSNLDSLAGSVFYQGQTSEGLTLLTFATTLLDVATAWLPGISWGRSVYEVVTGKGLISGQPLDNIAYGAAVVALMTGGIGEEAMKATTVARAITDSVEPPVVKAFEEAAAEFEKVWEAEKNVSWQTLEYGSHAHLRMSKLGLKEESQVDTIVKNGKPYFDASVRSADNTGLIYLIPRSEITALKPDEVESILGAAVTIDGENKVASVIQIDRPSLNDVEKILLDEISGEKRYQPMPAGLLP